MLIDESADREIYIVFQDDIEYRFSRFFRQGFKHCFAIERQALGWSCVDPSRVNLAASILPASFHDDVISAFHKQNPHATIIGLKLTPNNNKYTYPRPGFVSCVAIVKYMLGVGWLRTLTPYSLYSRLVNNYHDNILILNVWRPTPRTEE